MAASSSETAASMGEVRIPRLAARLPSATVNNAILEAFVMLGYEKPTVDQEEAILDFIKGRDVFVSLPTGAGKSLCFASLPVIFDNLRRHLQIIGGTDCGCIVLVVSPLIALMQDQVDKFHKRGLKCTFLGQDSCDKAAVIAGEYQLVYILPEYLLEDLAVRDMFRSQVYVDNFVALVVDEAHCIDIW